MGEKPPECIKSQVRGREAQVRLLPRARLLLSLGEHTQGRPPRRALPSHIPCDAAQPRAGEDGAVPGWVSIRASRPAQTPREQSSFSSRWG